MDEDRLDTLSNLIAELREVFPWDDDCDRAEIIHSPEWCLEAMIRQLTDSKKKEIFNDNR